MIITLLCEPRSGSTNLANWFSYYKNFTVLQEPLNKNVEHYKKEVPINEWRYDTEHLLIKEIYTTTKNLKKLIEFSDKIILLYRENVKEQLESWIVANQTNRWSSEWFSNNIMNPNSSNATNYVNSLKNGFKNEYLNDNSFFKISYEELYYNNGIQKIIDYLELDCVKNENFPYGKKYRINTVIDKLI
jgi:hypothetical protein